MPYIRVSTSAKIEDKKKLLEEISILVSSLTNKSKRFVMAKLDDDSEMYFGDESPCCFLEIKSIGSLNPSEIAKPISNFVNEKMGIPIDKIYISFDDVPASMWAWNGKTFG
nr:phenylpyruvate tautomerase MIF-related protein [Prochlorococcus marinus]